jgi:hypothetical protein
MPRTIVTCIGAAGAEATDLARLGWLAAGAVAAHQPHRRARAWSPK